MAKLTLVEDPTYPQKVTLRRSGGRSSDVIMTFKYRKRTDMLLFIQEQRKKVEDSLALDPETGLDKAPDPAADLERDIDLVMACAVGWGAEDRAGQPIEFNRDNIREVLEIHHHGANDIYKAYIESVQGAKLGN